MVAGERADGTRDRQRGWTSQSYYRPREVSMYRSRYTAEPLNELLVDKISAALSEEYRQKYVYILGPSGFAEKLVFTVPPAYITINTRANHANTKLVEYFGEIAEFRKKTYEELSENGANEAYSAAAQRKVLRMIEFAKLKSKVVEKVGGKPVPIPPHFLEKVKV